MFVSYDSTSGEEDIVEKKRTIHSFNRRRTPRKTYRDVYRFSSSSEESDQSHDDSEEEYVPSDTDTEEISNEGTYEIVDASEENGRGIESPSDEFLADVQEEPRTRTAIQIETTKNTSSRRVYDKKQCCLFCDKLYSQITKHWYSAHKTHPLVLEISQENDRKQKLALITLLRNKGNHFHNCAVLKAGTGTLLVAYRPKGNPKSWEDYRPCPSCLGYYIKTDLYRHRCKVRLTKPGGRVASRALLLLPCPVSCRPEVLEIISEMRDGPVKEAIHGDPLLLKLASRLFMRHGHSNRENMRAKLREMGRLINELKTFDALKNATLADCLKPKWFKTVITAVRSLAKFDQKAMKYKHPSVAIKLGHTIRKCCQILKGQGIETSDKQLTKDAGQFLDLCDLEWCEEVSHKATKELYERKRNATKRLPLAEDTVKLVNFLKQGMKDNASKLINPGDDFSSTWRLVAELALTYLIIFNRRRQGEVSKLKILEFSKAIRGSTNPDIERCLTKGEQQLCRRYYRVEIPGKRGRTVPVLMDLKVFETLTLLNKSRMKAGVSRDNPYVFGCNMYSSVSYIRGSDCLRKFSVDCGAEHPHTLTSTSFRKHVATMTQVMEFGENDLESLARHMGHEIGVHREHYRLPEDTLQLAKLSKLLLLMEQGKVEKLAGKTLDNILLDMEAG